MRRTTGGLIVTLTLSLLLAPLRSDAKAPGSMPKIGVLLPTSAAVAAPALEAFRQGLRAFGYRDSQDLILEYRFAEGQYDRLPALAAELVQLQVSVIVAGSPAVIRAATQATTTIPIVGIGVPTGFFASLTGSGTNLTGVAGGGDEVRKSGQAFLEELIPGLSRVAVLWDAQGGAFRRRAMEVGARLTGVRLQVLEVHGPHELERAFTAATTERAEAIIVPGSGLFAMHQPQIAELAVKNRLPTVAPFREFAEAGCLMAYGPNVADLFQRAASYVDQLLKGVKPGALPVAQPERFELVINLKTARALGLTVPQSLVRRAAVVIP